MEEREGTGLSQHRLSNFSLEGESKRWRERPRGFWGCSSTRRLYKWEIIVPFHFLPMCQNDKISFCGPEKFRSIPRSVKGGDGFELWEHGNWRMLVIYASVWKAFLTWLHNPLPASHVLV